MMSVIVLGVRLGYMHIRLGIYYMHIRLGIYYMHIRLGIYYMHIKYAHLKHQLFPSTTSMTTRKFLTVLCSCSQPVGIIYLIRNIKLT